MRIGTNKLSPQELSFFHCFHDLCSNNTNKLSPQEPSVCACIEYPVQIIQINLVLKNTCKKNLDDGEFK